ncbi:DUF4129 domain-containing protein [Gramella jeungdoensis]|uniref:DUF4129 domain-containing protein n=1 Tax=Gramella jeungdoensis TaxID=708091 RepID=A0ABT0Z4R8_9FLAO|nr:DUF4129 domain-containing protein [Gramella jeungdoensis]MCM8570716.1 DUF4129 domain-containing protein [Gramella jeungdoensis]
MKRGVLIIFLFLFFGSIYPQKTDSIAEIKEVRYDKSSDLVSVEFNRSRIEDYKNSEEFEYLDTTEKDNWWTRFKKWVNAKYNQFINWLFGEYRTNSVMAFIIEIIPFILLVLLLGLIAWLFSRLNPGGRILQQPGTSEVFLTEEEELVRNEDLPALMEEAVRNSQFRLAVRYYYLNELRKLDRLKLIEYEYQKTNRDYTTELKDENIRKNFSEITKLYEFIWYGSFQVSESDYRLAEKGFLRMERTLNSLGHE